MRIRHWVFIPEYQCFHENLILSFLYKNSMFYIHENSTLSFAHKKSMIFMKICHCIFLTKGKDSTMSFAFKISIFTVNICEYLALIFTYKGRYSSWNLTLNFASKNEIFFTKTRYWVFFPKAPYFHENSKIENTEFWF